MTEEEEKEKAKGSYDPGIIQSIQCVLYQRVS